MNLFINFIQITWLFGTFGKKNQQIKLYKLQFKLITSCFHSVHSLSVYPSIRV